MTKFIKIGVPVIVVVLGVGYGIGSYYANDIANKEASKVTTRLKNKTPEIQNITYGSVNAGFFSIFTHSVKINDVKISLKQMPNNPIDIKTIRLEDINVDSNSIPQNFEVSFSGLSVSNVDKMVDQYFLSNNNLTTSAYTQLSSHQMSVQEQNKKIINQYLKSIADQYAQAQLSGNLSYYGAKSQLSINTDVLVEGESIYQFDSLLSNYKIKEASHGFANALTSAKIESLDYKLHINKYGNKKILTDAFPQYKSVIDKVNPNFMLDIKYEAKTNDLSTKISLVNGKHVNIKSDILIHDVKLNKYTIAELQSSGINPAFDSAYFGKLNSTLNLSAKITKKDIEMMPLQYQKMVKMTFGNENLKLFFNTSKKLDFDKNGVGEDKITFGIKDIGDVEAYSDFNYTSKLYVKQVLKNINTSMNSISSSDKNQNTQMNLASKSDLALTKNIRLGKTVIEINNQSLIQDLIKLYGSASGQPPHIITQALQGQLQAMSGETTIKFQKDLFNSLAEYLNDPKKYSLTFMPKGNVTWADVLSNFNQETNTTVPTIPTVSNAENTANTTNGAKPLTQQPVQTQTQDNSEEMQQAFANALKLFNYQFNVNNKILK
ncbi:MAG: hypothetical protein ACJA0H_000164 [Francisellaceae bacterium]|jgi:hypothetical protein